MPGDTFLITRKEMGCCDFDAFMGGLDPERLTRAELAMLCGRVRIRFERVTRIQDLLVKPEARRFVRALHEIWPWAGYFFRCKPLSRRSPHARTRDDVILAGWVLCQVDDLTLIEWHHAGAVRILFNYDQFETAVNELLDRTEQMCHKAGLPKGQARQRRWAIEHSLTRFFNCGERP